MNRSHYSFILFLIAILFGCSSGNSSGNVGSDYSKGEGDLLYRLIEDKPGPAVADVAFVSVSYTERTEQGLLISETGKLDPRPSLLFARMPEFRGDFQDALPYLSEGDSAEIRISIDSLKKHKDLILSLSDSSRYMVFNVRINKVINRNGPADTLYPKRIEQFQAEQALFHQRHEKIKIERFLKQTADTFTQTPTGLYLSNGTQTLRDPSSHPVRVNYAFYTLDGKIMDTNRRGLAAASGIYSPREVYGPLLISSANAPIPAFREAITLVPPGGKARLLIPSALAFGNYGNSKNIPDFMPLICDFEVLR